jgi:glycosyltransferase involved in cell wall biosynthesis
MRVLFLTIVKIKSLEERGIYTDLLRKFRNEGHEIFAVSPVERRDGKVTHLIKEKNANLLQVKTLNLQKSNAIEKGIGTMLIEHQYLRAIKKHFSNNKFDLILYSTPPITFSKVVGYLKNRDRAFTYLLLKDIFPQNVIDMGFLKKNGILHKYFLKKERKLYKLSDRIGCMSNANMKYILEHNKGIDPSKIEVNPNSIEPISLKNIEINKDVIRQKFDLPQKSIILVYGGNLGVLQGIDFLLEIIKESTISDVFFLIVGNGTEYKRISKWFNKEKPKNAKLLPGLQKDDYDLLLQACDVGMIFLSHRFTIPNFPSRLLSYLEFGMPIVAATDTHTDVGLIIEESKCGFWLESGDLKRMNEIILELKNNHDIFLQMKKNARLLLERNYTVNLSYELIIKSFKSHNN